MSMTGIEAIAAERKRQMEEEGWTPEHDRQHTEGELALAAICYATPPRFRSVWAAVGKLWPWRPYWWKPTPKDRKREIVKAGALLAAEYDRLVAEEKSSYEHLFTAYRNNKSYSGPLKDR